MTNGNKLRAAREQAGLTMEQLKELSGVRAATICELENGKNDGSLKTWSRLQKVLPTLKIINQ